jgi:threonine aldolase
MEIVIDLRSDTVTRPSAAMREAIVDGIDRMTQAVNRLR